MKPTTYRSRSQAWTVAAILGTFGLVALQTTVSALADSVDGGVGSPGSWSVALAIVLTYCWWCLRLVFAMVQLGPTGVVVRNIFRTRRASWDEVERFSGERGIVVMYLRNGEQVAITALSGPNVLFRPTHQFVPKMAERLNADAEQFRRLHTSNDAPLNQMRMSGYDDAT